MDLNEFVAGFASLFEDTDPSEIQSSTRFHDLEEWGSLMGLCLIGHVKTTYNKSLSGSEIKEAETVEDLFDLLNSK